MKSFLGKSGFALAVTLMVLCCSCAGPEPVLPPAAPRTPKASDVETKTEKTTPAEPKLVPVEARAQPVEAKPGPAETRPAPPEQKPEQPPVAEEPLEPSDVVAEIDGQAITRGELQARLIKENRGDRDFGSAPEELSDAETVLLKMLGEKAMIIEGREGDLLKDSKRLREFYEKQMVELLLVRELSDKVEVTDAEVDAKLKADPKLKRDRARSMLLWAKRRQAVDKFYDRLCDKLNVEKLRYNFPKVAQAYQRLRYRPQTDRGRVFWIQHSQMENELTQEEKNTPLATYDGGRVTLMDWFETLNMIPPMKRPNDLETVEGVERLLDGTLRMPVLVAEAKLRRLDKDPDLMKQMAPREEQLIYIEVRRILLDGIPEPTEEEMRNYFDKNKDKFRTDDTLRIDQIWCQDLQTAKKVVSELDAGKDFASAKKEYSLKKDQKAFKTTASREGVFFSDLWAAEPNDIVGPVQGFYEETFRWRVVKILDKKPGRMQQYDKVDRKVKSAIRQQRRNAKLAEYHKQLLAKYPYKIYPEKFKDLDPLNIR